ncbi:MAG: hypothetical protein ACM3JB_11970 [Acidobacteriaceae bacterium]
MSRDALVSKQSESCISRLAKFFPDATPVRIPVRVTGMEESGEQESEQTVIEYGTPREVLFMSRLPFEFAGRLRLENSDGSLRTEAAVVAVQVQEGRTAVAARFSAEVSNWIVKPGA